MIMNLILLIELNLLINTLYDEILRSKLDKLKSLESN